MKYSRLEILVLAIAALAVVINVALVPPSAAVGLVEVVAQVLLLCVLAAAVHWGRRGGTIATFAASVVYVLMTIPLMVQAQGVDARIVQLIAVRIVTFGLVGILGGEIFSRLKYLFARLEDSCNVDAYSGLYNQRFMAQVLENWLGQHDRYGAHFSIIRLAAPPSASGKPEDAKSEARATADQIRHSIRGVDEAARLDDGSFLLLLPHTPPDGAAVVAIRLAELLRGRPSPGAAEVEMTSLCTLRERDQIGALKDELLAVTS